MVTARNQVDNSALRKYTSGKRGIYRCIRWLLPSRQTIESKAILGGTGDDHGGAGAGAGVGA
jgi:hypothetical protein